LTLLRAVAGFALAAAGMLVAPAAGNGQPVDVGAVTLRGSGPVTWVLVTGLVGGVSGYQRLESHLLRAGGRVLTVDPYRLSVDSGEVSFEALARRVERMLNRHGIDSARVVGHAHGAGVALRLAARAPERVTQLYLLDAGAIPRNRTRVFSASLRLVPAITRFPGGRGLVRWHLLRGLRQHSGNTQWLDPATERAYTEPVLQNISRVVQMAERLASATEPEEVELVVARTRAPITVILAGIPHPAAPDSSQVVALRPIGSRLSVIRLEGVGHFPHEEAPWLVARIMTGRLEQ
jgi:pimeloyl-ACP methyl ester carboxylesterase